MPGLLLDSSPDLRGRHLLYGRLSVLRCVLVRPHPRLDDATKLDKGGNWLLTIRPKCGEAVMVAQIPKRETGLTSKPNPARAQEEARRRAGVQVRRLVAEHKLTRMWTLTLRDQTLPEERPIVVLKLQQFLRRVRLELPQVVWLAVLEWHPGGHGWHIHIVVNRFVPKQWISANWKHGFVDVRRISVKGDSSSRQAVSKAASYLAKYVTKEPPAGTPPHVPGDHRYLRPLGLGLTELIAEGSYEEMVALAWTYFPTGVGWLWHSQSDSGWRAPPVLVLRSA